MAIDDKYSRREEYRGFTQDFKEKDGYKPDVKIEYVDETGRKLTPKEAFRQLSHRFHGKGSGKMKTERRMKKLDEEALLKKLSSSDTPLGTVALLQEKQKAQKTPYIVLSGSGKSMNANTITK
uniref:U4/U6.U5 tri-snRNP-associated protein 1-like n=1 Tax=Callithrix jacchus TaxID=9483 RepID=UPI00159CF2F1|nr:U4/U6.U5 tri-snRNP-associated protein 1-like [Callithrix jacchus]